MKTFFSLFGIFMISVTLTYMVGCFYNYFYPLDFQAEIIKASEEYDISPALIASIINVESGFREDAVSSKGAVGLMQIMPETAEWLCSGMGIRYDKDSLKSGKFNIKLGSKYLSMLLSSFRDECSAICAYNAGPNKVRSWIVGQTSQNDVLEKIPYKETSEYFNKVQKNLHFYVKRYGK